jgi:hypothetical protein
MECYFNTFSPDPSESSCKLSLPHSPLPSNVKKARQLLQPTRTVQAENIGIVPAVQCILTEGSEMCGGPLAGETASRSILGSTYPVSTAGSFLKSKTAGV